MASHHHPCHHPSAVATTPATCYCHCCYTPCLHHHHPPPPPESHLHHPPHQLHPYSPLSNLSNLPQYNEHFQEHYFEEGRQSHPTVSSLLRRIAALESALHRRSSRSPSSFSSLRDAAARTIQTHFRAFLLRRSVTLRQLKDLASIKSALGILKSSVSEKPRFDYDAIYHKAVNLLLKLDTIKGGDPMIRNGKSSLSRDLNKFLDFIEGFIVQRRGLSSGVNVRYHGENVKSWIPHSERKLGNVKCGDSKKAQIEKMRVLVERIDKLAEELDEEEGEPIEKPIKHFGIRKHANSENRTRGLLKQQDGVQPKAKKNVSFAENGKVYRVLRRQEEPSLEEYSDDSNDMDSLVDAERQLEDDLSPETQEIGASIKDDDDEEEEEEVHSEKGSDGEKEAHSYSTSEGNVERKRYLQDDTDDFTFSAPLPARMEKRGTTQLTRGRN